ncbi:hypothetical protein [Microbacterium dextranolyticum]|uniref:Uncharacterized protein n=1 Tax=Microbacterium dextranolyticum TaxID=36806 RepID=A0A9W6HN98_9MICO|nr:hypothetical protein [Microbacterium dextranolyticum]MBM7462552.1 cytochrome bd-type quinol oxidase subunit 2 [Microbacterium dextranolyticum]GLJ96410.1 hypothetical protein GCM10017591_24730 [Microbacterium dextranolyticum]
MTLIANHTEQTRSTFRSVARLWWLCAAVSVLALVAAAILAIVDPAEVNWVVWLRGSVVAVASVIFVFVTKAAARGSYRAYTRMRWISILAPVGIVLILVAPDTGYPIWMKVEQGVVGITIAAVAVLLNRPSTRRAFPKSR